jgi:hypothetical protein
VGQSPASAASNAIGFWATGTIFADTQSTQDLIRVDANGAVTNPWVTGVGAGLTANGTVLLDSSANIFVQDASNFGISKITPAGTVTYPWGSIPAAGGTNIAINSVGSVFAVDNTLSAVKRTLANGTTNLNWASLVAQTGQYVAVDYNDNVYVALDNGDIAKITPAASVNLTWNTSAAGAGTDARILAIDASYNIYAWLNNRTILKINSAGVGTLNWATGFGIIFPGGFVIDDVQQMLYFTYFGGICRVNLTTAAKDLPWVSLSGARDCALDSAGNLYVTLTNNFAKITPAGVVTNPYASASGLQRLAVYSAPTAPSAPTIGTATAASSTSATVSFTAGYNGGSPITGYTVTSSPGGITATGTSSPITVTGLTTGTPYTFTVTATNAIGTSSPSAASNSATPVPGNIYALLSDGTIAKITSSGVVTNNWAGITNASDSISIDQSGFLYAYQGTSSFIRKYDTSTASLALTFSGASANTAPVGSISNFLCGRNLNIVDGQYYNSSTGMNLGGLTTTSGIILDGAVSPTTAFMCLNGNLYTAVPSIPGQQTFTQVGNWKKAVYNSGDGNFYSLDGSNKIYRVTSANVGSLWATSVGSITNSIGADNLGNLYITSEGNDTITQITSAGVKTLSWKSLPAGSGPGAIIVDAYNNIYVANQYTFTISKISSAGTVTNNFATFPSVQVIKFAAF